MGRRGNNEGSVFKRKDGRWCAAVTTGYSPETGKPIRAYYYDTTRAGVVVKRDEALRGIKAGTYVKPTKETVEAWLKTWLDAYVAPSVRPKTWEGHESIIRVHLVPALGQIDLRALQTNQVQRLLNDKMASGLSPRTVELIHTTLKSALKQAQLEGMVTRNVADHVRKPKGDNKEIRVLTAAEMDQLIAVALADRLGPVVITMLGTGLRLGEVLALEWSNVNLQDSLLQVQHTAVQTKTPTKSKRQKLIQSPKTDSGKRAIPLPADVVSILRQWSATQAQEKLKLGSTYTDSGRVFTSSVGTPLLQRNLARKLSELAAKANIKHVNPHALRHTYATRLLEANVHPKVVQELLGHTDITLTLNTYSHVMPEIKKAAAKALDAVLKLDRKPPEALV
ncbi:MAG: site-specific integrase [Thermaerobacter sp.]|nr:site-specific integrase [Thermaerobacter sp.]